jgi:L-fuconolactonase
MSQRPSRRGFLAQAAAGTVIASTAAHAAERRPEFPIVDTHQHLWDRKNIWPTWLSDPAAAKIATPHTMSVYLREAKGLGIVRTVYMEVDAAEEDQAKEAEFVIETCRGHRTPMRKGVISGRPATPAFAEFARRYKESPYIFGFRQILHPPNRPRGLCLQPQFVENVRLLGELGKTFDVCIRPGELEDACKLADLCPGTRFVLDHCGNAEANWGGSGPEFAAWAKGMTEVARRKNVIGKVSGVIKTCKPGTSKVEQLKPIVRHTLEVFGPDRVIWASDWPVCEFTAPLREWVEVARALTADLPAADQRKLFHDNAVRYYGIS